MIPFMSLLLYTLHPLHVEVFASIKSRDTLLSAFFAFWAINYWLKNTGGLNWQKNLIISLLFLIALQSKEEALTIVAVVFLISFYFLNNDSYQSFKSTFPFMITATGYLVLRMIVLDTPTSNYDNLLNTDSPDVVSTCKNLGASYLSLKEYNKAIQAYEKALEYRSDPDIKSSLAMLYSSIGEFEKSNQIMSNNTAITLEEKNFNNLMNAGIGAYNQGKYAEAIEYFKQCDPLFEKFGGYIKFPDFLNSWARSHLNIGQVIEAKAIFQRVILVDPRNYYAMMNLGNIAFHNETNYSLATFYFSKCIESNSPDYFLSFSNLGTLYLIQNQPEKAIENYEKSLKYGTSEMVIRNLFLLWRSKGNQEKMVHYNALINANGNRN